jgi:LysR family hydrogen peroxide-inducible transcriptional activator
MQPEIELYQLKYFLAVARAGNFTRAAEQLNVSQPTLSRSIQKLETRIGQPLFERKPREVTLTDLGELFVSRAEQILALVEDTFSQLTEAANSGRIRVGVIPTIAPFFLPTVLQDFATQHPDVSVVVQEDTTDNLLKRCSHGDVDLAILALPISARYLEIESLFEEELVLVMPPQHPLVKKKSIKLADVKELAFVMLDEAHCLSDNIAAFCQRQQVQPVSIERTSQLATVQELVSLGHGISMVPKMAQVLDKSKRRVYRSFAGVKPARTVAMVGNPYRYESKWLAAFKQHLRAVGKELA